MGDTLQQGSRRERATFSDALRDLFNRSSSKDKGDGCASGKAQEEETKEEEGGEDSSLEEAIAKALRFRDMWMKIDVSGDRFLSLEELEQYMPPTEARALLETADINKDGELTFAELAIKILRYG